MFELPCGVPEIRRVYAALVSPDAPAGTVEGWVGLVAACQGSINALGAVQAYAMARVAAFEPQVWQDGTVEEVAGPLGHSRVDGPSLVAGPLGVSEQAAASRMAEAVRLATCLRPVLEVMAGGGLDRWRASVVAAELHEAPDQVAHRVAQTLAGRLGAQTAGPLRRRVVRELAAIDPELVRQRAARARAERSLRRVTDYLGVDRWEACVPLEDSRRAWAAVDQVARGYLDQGRNPTLEQARADAMIDLILGNTHATCQVELAVPQDMVEELMATLADASAATGLDSHPGPHETAAPGEAPDDLLGDPPGDGPQEPPDDPLGDGPEGPPDDWSDGPPGDGPQDPPDSPPDGWPENALGDGPQGPPGDWSDDPPGDGSQDPPEEPPDDSPCDRRGDRPEGPSDGSSEDAAGDGPAGDAVRDAGAAPGPAQTGAGAGDGPVGHSTARPWAQSWARACAGMAGPGRLVEVAGCGATGTSFVRVQWLQDLLSGSTHQTLPSSAQQQVRVAVVGCDPVTGARTRPSRPAPWPGTAPATGTSPGPGAARPARRGRDRAVDSAAYRPPAGLVALVKARDGRCRFPGCSISARFCDLDHVRPWPAGPTTAGNLVCLCRRHHRIKQRPGWRARLDPDGILQVTDPTGRVRTSAPVDLLGRHDGQPVPPSLGTPPPGQPATFEPYPTPAGRADDEAFSWLEDTWAQITTQTQQHLARQAATDTARRHAERRERADAQPPPF